jgi:hypothetical protein
LKSDSPGKKEISIALRDKAGGAHLIVPCVIDECYAEQFSATIDPSTLSYGSQKAGAPGEPRSFTVTNTGTIATGTLPVPVLSGPNLKDFAVTSSGCGGSMLSPGKSCKVDVVFSPKSAGTKSAMLTVMVPVRPPTSPMTLTATLSGIAEP